MAGVISHGREKRQFCLMKNPLLYRSAWPESSREASERFLMETLGRTQSERRRRLAWGRRFSAVRLSGTDRLDVLGIAAVRGSISPDGQRHFASTSSSKGSTICRYRTRQNRCRPICLVQKRFYTLATHLISIMNSGNARR